MRLIRSERAAVQRRERRAEILAAAAQEAQASNYMRMTRAGVMGRLGRAHGGLNHEFGTMDGLRVALMEYAIENELLPIVAQGLAMGDPVAQTAPEALRTAASRELI